MNATGRYDEYKWTGGRIHHQPSWQPMAQRGHPPSGRDRHKMDARLLPFLARNGQVSFVYILPRRDEKRHAAVLLVSLAHPAVKTTRHIPREERSGINRFRRKVA
jgi:hypothetical protein